jgi:hypothetical protein
MGFDSGSFDLDSFDQNAFEFDIAAAPVFEGPNIGNLLAIVNVPSVPVDYSSRFSGSGLTFSIVGTLPAGLSLSSAGVLSGTPTETGTFADLVVQATDGTDTADSNAFSITVQVANPGADGGRRSGLYLAIRIGI